MSEAMEISKQIKKKRTEAGMSQDDLAEAIYVSRQTISNWETDKTYPDVQSLLLLSEVLNTSIDELVQGDVAIMRQAMAEDSKKLTWLSWGITISIVLALIFFIVLSSCWQENSGVGNLTYGNIAGVFVFLPLYVLAMIMAGVVERIKRRNDLVTYREIDAFMKGDTDSSIERSAQVFSRRHPGMSTFIKVSMSIIAGGTIGVVLYKIFA